jgi:hypothetical protein
LVVGYCGRIIDFPHRTKDIAQWPVALHARSDSKIEMAEKAA